VGKSFALTRNMKENSGTNLAERAHIGGKATNAEARQI